MNPERFHRSGAVLLRVGLAITFGALSIVIAVQSEARQTGNMRGERTGRAVCLLFLSGNRVIRFIPEGGLDIFFDWAKHQTAHAGDSGRWEMRGGQVAIAWGDGGVHQGPLTVRPDGIEFYGKRYTKPVSASVRAAFQKAFRWASSKRGRRPLLPDAVLGD